MVARVVRDDEVAGSNPVIPTIFIAYEPEPLGRVAGIFILEVGYGKQMHAVQLGQIG